MGKIVVRCKVCGSDKWIPKKNPNPSIPEDKECAECGASYCAKNRSWDYEE